MLAEVEAERTYAKETLEVAKSVKDQYAGAISKIKYEQALTNLKRFDAQVTASQANVQRARSAYTKEAQAAINLALAKEELRLREVSGPEADATIAIALARDKKARLAYESKINGENTTVAQYRAELAEALYYLKNYDHGSPRGWLHY